MAMDLTADAVTALAPDGAAAAAGRKLARPAAWTNLGQSDAAVWGECQGSALYQVRVDAASLTTACSCPSRKIPCKHALGLLYLIAGTPGEIPHTEPPEWVAAWLSRRAAAATRKSEGPAATPAGSTTTTATPSRRADRRQALVAAGLDALDLWLADLVRNGLAAVETQPYSFWERQAARMVDAQAPGIAARLRAIAAIPNASSDWPRRLLAQLGRLALLTDAYRRLDTLDPLLQEDVRQAIGWTLKEEEVVARGEHVADDWLVLDQDVRGEDHLRVQRTWLLGGHTRRTALVLQFVVGSRRFEQMIAPGTHQDATLVYWPSACPQRALIHARYSRPASIASPLPGAESIDAFLEGVARASARQPWLDRALCVLSGATPRWGAEGHWLVHDRDGHSLPLARGEWWELLAVSGGYPVDLAAEWDGDALLPLGVVADGSYHRIQAED